MGKLLANVGIQQILATRLEKADLVAELIEDCKQYYADPLALVRAHPRPRSDQAAIAWPNKATTTMPPS